jgi:hypothetical protein
MKRPVPRRSKEVSMAIAREPQSPPSRLLSFTDAAARASNSPAWWRKLAARRQIPMVKLGRSSRLREEDVNRIIAEGFRLARPGEPR